MPATVIVTRQPVDATQQGSLRSLFSSAGFSLLKELVAAQCIDKQVEAMNRQLYPANPTAAEDAVEYAKAAVRFNNALDVLLDLEKNDDWWTVKLESTR